MSSKCSVPLLSKKQLMLRRVLGMLRLGLLASGIRTLQQASRQLLPVKVLLSSGVSKAQEPKQRVAAVLPACMLGQLMMMMLDWQLGHFPRLKLRRRCWGCLEKVKRHLEGGVLGSLSLICQCFASCHEMCKTQQSVHQVLHNMLRLQHAFLVSMQSGLCNLGYA